MVRKRKSQPESLPSASGGEESDSALPARKRPRNGHVIGQADEDASDEDTGELADVKPEGVNGENADDSEAEQEDDYEEERNEEGGEIIRRKKRVTVKLERGADGCVFYLVQQSSPIR
jgi:hypothetical protein